MDQTIRIFVDMDDTLCDFTSAHKEAIHRNPRIKYPQSQLDFFRQLRPIPEAIDAMKWMKLLDNTEVHILTAPSIKNPLCYMEKRLWIEDHLGLEWVDQLHISPRKDFFIGDILIDDQLAGKGQESFAGIHIPFGLHSFKNWKKLNYFLERILSEDFQFSTQELVDLFVCQTNTPEKLSKFQLGDLDL